MSFSVTILKILYESSANFSVVPQFLSSNYHTKCNMWCGCSCHFLVPFLACRHLAFWRLVTNLLFIFFSVILHWWLMSAYLRHSHAVFFIVISSGFSCSFFAALNSFLFHLIPSPNYSKVLVSQLLLTRNQNVKISY
jgi:hypothetical protein